MVEGGVRGTCRIESADDAEDASEPKAILPTATQAMKQQLARAELYGDPLLTLQEAQSALGSPSYSTLREWIATGYLKTWRIGKRGHHKVHLSEVRRLLALGAERQ